MQNFEQKGWNAPEGAEYGELKSCADHNHDRILSERRYLRHGESTYKYQVSTTIFK